MIKSVHKKYYNQIRSLYSSTYLQTESELEVIY